MYLATHPHSIMPAVRKTIGARKAVCSGPDDEIIATIDVPPWLRQSVAAVMAHRSNVAPRPPGSHRLPARGVRGTLLSTGWT